jgi:hypothetical protein
MYSVVGHSLSEWEQHCLSSALIFEQHGYFEKALTRIGEVFEPPVPLPFLPPPITLDDVSRRHRGKESRPRRRPRAGPKRY